MNRTVQINVFRLEYSNHFLYMDSQSSHLVVHFNVQRIYLGFFFSGERFEYSVLLALLWWGRWCRSLHFEAANNKHSSVAVILLKTTRIMSDADVFRRYVCSSRAYVRFPYRINIVRWKYFDIVLMHTEYSSTNSENGVLFIYLFIRIRLGWMNQSHKLLP